MPPVRTARASRKAPPEGFDDIEDTLLEFQNKMKDAENASHEGKKKYEMMWPIFQITHQRSRYIYDLYYEKEAISKQLYDYLLKNGYADAMLIAKWKKQGYEKASPFYTGNLLARIKLTHAGYTLRILPGRIQRSAIKRARQNQAQSAGRLLQDTEVGCSYRMGRQDE
ncbi:hypothetical protein J4E89_006669 [Alternaria sp. Ai002NY15]|nr:hypothetical protein J4E89_006669 [Alternaria sp. Ai002NY15]